MRGRRKTWTWSRWRDKRAYKATLGTFPAFRIADAEAWANDLDERFERGEDVLVSLKPAPAPARTTVAEAWRSYIEDRLRAGKRSVAKLDMTGKKDIVATIGTMCVGDVSAADVQKVIAGTLVRGRGCTAGQARSNAVLRVTRTFFAWCVKREIDGILRNPARPIDPIQNIEGHRVRRILSVREFALLVLAAREYDRRSAQPSSLADAVTIMVGCGNRKSEVIYAARSEWDTEAKVWRIGRGRYKTGVAHGLPVAPGCAAIFDRLCSERSRTPFLIPDGVGIRSSRDNHLVGKLHGIMEEIGGEPLNRWTYHAVRYGFRSNIRKERTADSELAERLIHPKAKDAMSQWYDPDHFDEMRTALRHWESRINQEIASIVASRMRLTG